MYICVLLDLGLDLMHIPWLGGLEPLPVGSYHTPRLFGATDCIEILGFRSPEYTRAPPTLAPKLYKWDPLLILTI